jgi:hypothetical protein
MAENKKSVLLYCDIIHTVEELSDEEAGKLFKHYLRYVNDLNPEPPDKLTKVVFEPIRQHLKRDLKNWQTKCERNSLIAKASWNKRKDANVCERIKPDAKNADNDNDNDNDKDMCIATTQTQPEVIFPIEHCIVVAMNDPRWVKANSVKKQDLEKFNQMLEKQGTYEKNPMDYKRHYANWIKKGMPEEFKNETNKHNEKIRELLKIQTQC